MFAMGNIYIHEHPYDKKFNILNNFVYSGKQVDLYYNDNEISFI